MNSRRALVTGVAGFIGSRLAAVLLDEGWSVVGVDVFTDYYDVAIKRDRVRQLRERGISFIEGDLLNLDLAPLLDEVDVVFHQAGQPGVRSSWGTEFAHYTRNNVDVTQRILEATRASSNRPKIIYASSSSVYGNAESYPTRELVVPRPISPYGVTKLAAEHLVTLYGTELGLSTVSLRYFTVYGPGQRPDMAFTRFCKALVEGQAITINGKGEQVRDFTFVDDVVRANILAAQTDTPSGAVYNISGGSDASVLEVIEMLEQISGARVPRKYLADAIGDVRRTGGDIERVEKDLGWRPVVGLLEGLTLQLAWARRVFTHRIT